MICGACGHRNDEDEHRCAHCGRSVTLSSDSSWKRAGLDASPGPMPVERTAGTSARPWRHEISRRLDEYRDKQRGDEPDSSLAAGDGEKPSPPLPNLISIDKAAAARQPAGRGRPGQPSPERRDSERLPMAQPATRSGYGAMARLGQRVPDLPSIPAVRREHVTESAAVGRALPPIGVDAGGSLAPIAADHLPAPVRAQPGGVQCEAGIAPLRIRMLAGVLDVTMIVIALGTFLAVFHWSGGRWIADNNDVRTMGITSFVLVAFYWVFYVGHFGETPGMTWTGLRLVNFYGQKPNTTQRAARALGLILSSATLGLGFAWSIADEEKLTWHDRMSRTFLTCGGARSFPLRSPLLNRARKDAERLLPDPPPAGKI